MKKAIVVVFGVMGFAGSATAQAPVAVVEEVQGNVTGAEFMDYVVPGKVIKLGQGASVVLGYMKSCRRESISGIGTVIVGQDESKVHLAEVEGTKTECDPAQAHRHDKGNQRRRRQCRPQPGKRRTAGRPPADALRHLAAGRSQGARHAGVRTPRPEGRAPAV